MLAAILVCVGIVARLYYDTRAELKCRLRLGRPFYDRVVKDDQMLSVEEQAEIGPLGQCPKSSLRYVYRPVASPLVNWREDDHALRMIAWCPTHCHRGGRSVLLENGGAYWVSETVFQNAILAGLVLTSNDVLQPDG